LRLSLFSLLLSLGCTTTVPFTVPDCDITIHLLEPTAASPGDDLRIEASPLTTDFDTAVTVAGQRATVLEVNRDSCEETPADGGLSCDDCREANDCNPCDDCDACDATCADTCVEFALVTLPESLQAGPADVQIINSYGRSNTAQLTIAVAGPVDTGDSATSDSGTSDSGTSDSGASDSGASDSGASDSGASDSGGGDTSATSDSGASDSGGDTSATSDSGGSGDSASAADSGG
jgi:hypothetical protein